MTGVSSYTCFNGARYLRIHYSADPGKDRSTPQGKEWYAKYGPPRAPQKEWDREMEMSEIIHDGEPVYPDYIDNFHCYLDGHGQLLPIPIMKGCVYIGGVDCGTTLNPAFVLLQVMTQPPYQVHAILEIATQGHEPMDKFAPRVVSAVRKLLPGAWVEVEYWADQTVTTMNGANGETTQAAARRHGLNFRRSSNELQPRLAAVTWLLTERLASNDPLFLVDGTRCPILREGFQGAYKLDVSPSGDAVGPGRVLKEKPLKNSFSDIHDALQYAAMPIFKQFAQGKEPSRGSRNGLTEQQNAIAAILGRQV